MSVSPSPPVPSCPLPASVERAGLDRPLGDPGRGVMAQLPTLQSRGTAACGPRVADCPAPPLWPQFLPEAAGAEGRNREPRAEATQGRMPLEGTPMFTLGQGVPSDAARRVTRGCEPLSCSASGGCQDGRQPRPCVRPGRGLPGDQHFPRMLPRRFGSHPWPPHGRDRQRPSPRVCHREQVWETEATSSKQKVVTGVGVACQARDTGPRGWASLRAGLGVCSCGQVCAAADVEHVCRCAQVPIGSYRWCACDYAGVRRCPQAPAGGGGVQVCATPLFRAAVSAGCWLLRLSPCLSPARAGRGCQGGLVQAKLPVQGAWAGRPERPRRDRSLGSLSRAKRR